eukprot:3663044-Rhodomonas_salina.1
MARQTVRCPPAQHTGRTEWPDTVRDPPTQHTGLAEWPDKLSDTLRLLHTGSLSTQTGWNGPNCQTPSSTAH